MRLSKITISGYRGFSSQQSISFAQPTGKEGSGLTVLVGPNNAGKSSVVEILSFLRATDRDVILIEGQKNAKKNGEVKIEYQTDKETFILSTVSTGGAQWSPSRDKQLGKKGSILALQSRRALNSEFQLNPQDRGTYIANLPDFASRQQNLVNSFFNTRLKNIEDRKDDFRNLLARVLPKPPAWYIEGTQNGMFYIKVTSSSSPHRSDGLGQGVISVLQIIDALWDSSPDDIIVIDEPELSLHPSAQRRLSAVLAEYAGDRQIILATHSPFFAPIEYLEAGATVARIYQEAGSTAIGQITQSTISDIAPLLQDRHNPHVLGLDAREVFFLEDQVILVEGQDDVLAYPQVFEQLGKAPSASFYGWGVGGANKMGAVAQMLKDLGIRRVCGLLDKGQEETARDLADRFPEFKFFVLPAEDIRTKPARTPKNGTEGLLDNTGNVRPKYRAATESIISEVCTYFEANRLTQS